MTMTAPVQKAMSITDGVDLVAFAKSGSLSKAELFDVITRQADRQRRADRSPGAQAFADFVQRDPVGKSLHGIYSKMRGPGYAVAPAPVAKIDSTADQLARIRKLIYKNNDDPAADGADPARKLAGLVDGHRAKFPKMSRSDAYTAVLATPQGRECMQADKARMRRAG